MVLMAYESWSQVVIRTVLEWEKRKAELQSNSDIPKQKTKSKNKTATILNGCPKVLIYAYFFSAAIGYLC